MKNYLVKSPLSAETFSIIAPFLSASPITMSYPFMATLGLVVSDTPPMVESDAVYLSKFRRMSINRSPFTGNSCLFAEMNPSDVVIARAQELYDLSDMELPRFPMFMEMSHQVHEIPRNRRAWINSLSESFVRMDLVFKFEGEFYEEIEIDPRWIGTWPQEN